MGPKPTKKSRHAIAQSRNLVVPTLQSLQVAPIVDQVTHAQSVLHDFKRIRRAFDEFFDDLVASTAEQEDDPTLVDQPRAIDILPGNPRNTDQIFCRNTTGLDFVSASSFLEYALSERTGLIDDTITLRTALNELHLFKMYWKWKVGKPLEEELKGQLYQFIKIDLQKELGFSMARKELVWTDDANLKIIAKSFVDINYSMSGVRCRLQMLFWLAFTKTTGLRIGSLLPQPKSLGENRQVVWRDFHLNVIPSNNVEEKGPLNRFTVSGICPNGKTASSAFIDFDLEQNKDLEMALWQDPVFLFVALAKVAGVLPEDFDLETLMDPGLFQKPDSPLNVEIPLKEDMLDQEVFIGSVNVSDYRWTANTVYDYLARANWHTGQTKMVGPHAVRRSQGLKLSLLKVDTARMVRFFKHLWGSSTFRQYVKPAITANATSAVYKTKDNTNEIHQMNPFRSEVNPVMLKALPANDRVKIFEHEQYEESVEIYASALQQALAKYQVDTIDQLPKACRAQINNLWDRASAVYRRLYRAARTNVASRPTPLTLHQDVQDEAVENAVENVEEDEEDEDEDDEDDDQYWCPSEEGDDGMEEQSVVEEEEDQEALGEDYLDDFPSIDAAQGDIYQAEKFLSQYDFLDPQQNVDIALEVGIIDEEEHERLSSQNVVNSIELLKDQSIPIDPALLSEEDTNVHPQDPVETHLDETQSAVDNESQPPPPKKLRLLDSAQSSTQTHQEVQGSTKDQADESITGVDQSNLAAFLQLEPALFNSSPVFLDAFNIVTNLPTDDTLIFAYRPGHVPIDDKCPFCSQPLEKFIQNTTSPPIRYRTSHVESCGKAAAIDFAKRHVFPRYPSSITVNPLDDPSIPRRKAVPSLFKLAQQVDTKLQYYRPVTCKTCDPHSEFPSLARVTEHLMLKHDILLPPTQKQKKDLEWSYEKSGLPCQYHTQDGQYHTDPKELYHFAKKMYHDRIVEKSKDVAGYGVRTDILIPSNRLQSDKNNLPSDDKYEAVNGKFRSYLVDGLCMICVNNPHLDMASRVYNRGRDLIDHRKHCVSRTLAECRLHSQDFNAGDKVARHTHYIWHDGHLKCPDPVCQRSNIEFTEELDWLDHLTGVHHFKVRGPGTSQRIKPINLTQLTFVDSVALKAFYPTNRKLQRRGVKQAGINKRSATHRAKTKQPVEPQTQKKGKGKGKGK